MRSGVAEQPPRGEPRAATGVRARLRAGTAEQHERLDRRLAPLLDIDEGLAPVRYRALLAAFRGFYAPLEQALTAALRRDPAPVWLGRTGWLDEDLLAMGLDPPAIARLPGCRPVPPAGSVPEALGCCYVLEGAALGGRVIAARLAPAGGPASLACRYFAGHGADTGRRWGAFLRHLERRCAGEQATALALAAARATFERLETWLEEREVIR